MPDFTFDELPYVKDREMDGNTPIYDSAIDELIASIPGLETQMFEGVSLALRFVEHDNYIPDCHMTLKYFKRASFGNIFKHYVNFDKLMPVQLGIAEFKTWKGFDDTHYSGLVFDRHDLPELYKQASMPHITMKNVVSPQELKYLVWDAEFIASEVFIGHSLNGKHTYTTLLEFLNEQA